MSSHKVVSIESCQKVVDDGFSLWQKETFKRNVLSEENVYHIRAWLEISTCKLRHLALETGVSLVSVFTATRLIIFHPYKITYVDEIRQPDHAAIIHFYIWLLQNVYSGSMAAIHNWEKGSIIAVPIKYGLCYLLTVISKFCLGREHQNQRNRNN
jgi:hypothetical protein